MLLGGLAGYIPRGRAAFPKGELTHTLFDCLKACLLRFTFTLGSLIYLLGDLQVKISDLGGEQFGRDSFKTRYRNVYSDVTVILKVSKEASLKVGLG